MCDNAFERTSEIVSSLFYLPAVYVTYRDGQYAAMLWITASMIASVLYHLCDTLNDGLDCFSYCLLSNSVGFFLDESLVFLVLITVVLYRVQYDATPAYTISVIISATTFMSFPVESGTNTDTQSDYMTGFGVGFAVLLFLDRVYRDYKESPRDWFTVRATAIVAVVLGAIAITAHSIQYEWGGDYGWLHTAWHVTGSLAVLFALLYVDSFFLYTSVGSKD